MVLWMLSLATASVVVETEAMKQTTDVTGNEAVGAMTRLLYHPFTEPGKMFHVGISGGIEVTILETRLQVKF